MRNLITTLFIITAIQGYSQSPNWKLFNHTNTPFVSDSITWVEVDTSNVKWVGTCNGLYSFYNNIWTVYNTSNSGIPNNRIDKFKIAYDNTIWFLNHNNGFIKFKSNVFTLINKGNTPSMNTDSLIGLTIDSNDVFLWSANNGIVKYNATTSSVLNINTSNSCLRKIKTLQYHNNHIIYGLATPVTYTTYSLPPVNKADSIEHLQDFVIINTSLLTFNYCFAAPFFYCNYYELYSDKFQNREEQYTPISGSGLYMRHFDKNNALISNNVISTDPGYQRLFAPTGFYKLIHNSIDEIYTPFGNFNQLNSIIPSFKIINMDIDKQNNIWIATQNGLVAYNNAGVITGNEKKDKDYFQIYPNPVNSSVNIEFVNFNNDSYLIEILNELNQIILSEKITTANYKIVTENILNGMYYFIISTKNSKITKKIVIQH